MRSLVFALFPSVVLIASFAACASGGDADTSEGGAGGESNVTTGVDASSSTTGSGQTTASTSGGTTAAQTTAETTGGDPTCSGDDECGSDELCDGTGHCAPPVKMCLNQMVTLDNLMHTDGDTEFEGHGPVVDIDVTPKESGGKVTVTVKVQMKESKSDFTTGVKEITVNVPTLTTLRTGPVHLKYTDTDHNEDDVFAEGTVTGNDASDPAVKSAKCSGDRDGDDICSAAACSHCKVELGCFIGTQH